MSEILTVFGSTGNQGGSVIKSVLAHPELSKKYKIRAVTRDPSKASGQALASQGCEVVKADMNDASTIAAAVQGASAVFAVTNFWETMSRETEVAQGKAIADAAKQAGVKHLVWSSLLNVSKTTNGKLVNVQHFDGKADVEEYIRAQGVPASFFMPGPFMTFIVDNIAQSKSDKGYTLALPFEETDVIPLFHVADSGKFVAGMLLAGPTGERVAASTGFYTGPELAKAVKDIKGTETAFAGLPYDTWVQYLPPNMQKELGENMLFIKGWQYYGEGAKKKVEDGHKIAVEKPTTWEEVVRASSL